MSEGVAEGNPLPDDSVAETTRSSSPVSGAASEHGRMELGQGVYHNRVAGSWVNVPPPDRHYQGSASDPLAPSGAG